VGCCKDCFLFVDDGTVVHAVAGGTIVLAVAAETVVHTVTCSD
jgi:hypothetical protein